jgi:hypothetical protein
MSNTAQILMGIPLALIVVTLVLGPVASAVSPWKRK